MQIKCFTIRIKRPEEAEQDANRFLRSHRILATDRRFVDNGENALVF